MVSQFARRTILMALMLILVGCRTPAATEPSHPPLTESPTVAPEENERAVPPVSAITLPPTGTDGYPWWNDTVWYEVFVRSFYDSDGDGIGDIQGLIQKLDYLNDGNPTTTSDLGVTGLWLMPVMESPSYHGYDVVDYYQVEADYGNNEDFKQLMEEAHQRGMRVIVDMVLNHTSSQHPWFQAAREGDAEREAWYIFHEGERPTEFAPWGGGNIWHPAGENRSYYGIFWSEMPDLNYENPAVTREVETITQFWLEEMGADGFRLDAIRHLIETDGVLEHTEETHTWLEEYHNYVRSIEPDDFIVGEVWSPTDQVIPYIGEELDTAFEFTIAQNILDAANNENAGTARFAYAIATQNYPDQQFAPFIANHDQNRAFSTLKGNMDHMKMAAAMLLTGPGTPFIYYGEEIAMRGMKPDEDIRKPMSWTGDEAAGFTTGTPWRDFSQDYETNNVAAMSEEPESLLNLYRRLIALRNEHEALRIGEYLVLQSSTNGIYPFIRQSNDETLLVLHNLTGDPISDYRLSLKAGAQVDEGAPAELFQGATVMPLLPDEQGGFTEYTPIQTLEPYRTYIIQLRP
ncbi:MAG: alpha-amylase [Ardenticatenales bacterium]|nr:alpha-amylase [Ardenticatenales bacterium]